MRWLVVHPSDEMYGADRMLLEVIDALGAADIASCWLPTDVNYPDHGLCQALLERNVRAEHRPIPVLRRRYMNPAGLARLAARGAGCLPAIHSLRGSVDAVYLNTSAVLPMAPLLKRRGRKVIVHIHESWGPEERRLLRPLLRFCDMTIAISHAVAAGLDHPAVVVHNGLPDLDIAPTPPPDGSVLQVVMASRWSSWKGHREFLLAWQRAARRDAHLTIAGGCPPAGEGVDVPALVHELGLADSVTIAGEQAEITDLLRMAHLAVVPSVKPEPFGLVAIEAARVARAVMASDSGGLREIVRPGETGWLVEPGNVAAWAAGLRQVSVEDATRRGMAARRDFETRFRAERFTADLREAVYG